MGAQGEELRGAGVKGWHLGSVSASGLVVGPSENKEQGLKTGRQQTILSPEPHFARILQDPGVKASRKEMDSEALLRPRRLMAFWAQRC